MALRAPHVPPLSSCVSGGVSLQQQKEKRSRMKTAVGEIQDFLDTCRDMPEPLLDNLVGNLFTQDPQQWCENIALITNSLCGSNDCGPRVCKLMNCTIHALTPGESARSTYDTLVQHLRGGYTMIRAKAQRGRRLLGELSMAYLKGRFPLMTSPNVL